ncbi:hypothetical protein KSP39_PZI007266 [Platanthera zijinensis]|uniref:Uncharacterized protein n=1 Tax=Platanthera zijinensis TaxID=2320716 RepID=A0AAP0BRT2_9ASPA
MNLIITRGSNGDWGTYFYFGGPRKAPIVIRTYRPPTPPAATTAITSTNLSAVPPPDYNDVYKKAKITDSKAMNILANTMSDETFQNVADCTSAKAIRDSLNHIIAGSADERKDRRSNLTSQNENFKKTEAESVDAMYTRLSSIINELRTLDKEITLTEGVNQTLTIASDPSCRDVTVQTVRSEGERRISQIAGGELAGACFGGGLLSLLPLP